MSDAEHITIIKPTKKLSFPDFNEAFQYRDLFIMLLIRDIKSRFAQSVLGFGWAFIQPLMRVLIFSVIFGNIAKVNSEGIPYMIYSAVAIIPWTFFSNSLSTVSNSLNSFSSMINKIYFPRIVIPFSSLLSRFVDFSISFTIIIGLMLWYRVIPSPAAIFIPLFVLILSITSLGLGIWLSTLAIKYRDVNYSLSFFIQLGMYLSPVVYGLNQIPEKYKLIYALNPTVGVIEGFRSVLLSTNPIPWKEILIGTAVALILLITALLKFKSTEKYFADVI